MENQKSRVAKLQGDLADKYAERVDLKKRLSSLHQNNSKGIKFDIYELKGLESDISIVSDEIESLIAKIESLKSTE